MSQLKGAEHLLDGYISSGKPMVVTKNYIQYTVQRYQGEHENEFVLRSPTGDVYLYENNVLKQCCDLQLEMYIFMKIMY